MSAFTDKLAEDLRKLSGIIQEYIWVMLRSVARFTLRRWNPIVIVLVLVLLGTSAGTIMNAWSKEGAEGVSLLGHLVSLAFGACTFLGLLASVAVLTSVRGLITHYSHVPKHMKQMIEGINESLYILTTNPAFLQVLLNDDFECWAKALDNCLTSKKKSIKRIVFAYVERPTLGKYLEDWAGNDRELRKWKGQLFNTFLFHWCNHNHHEVRPLVRFVPLDAEELEYFIAVADTDQTAIFCRAQLDRKHKERSQIRGFKTEDPHITEAFRGVFEKTVELSGIVYDYTCTACVTAKTTTHRKLFDHELWQEKDEHDNPIMTISNCFEIPPKLTCKTCKKDVDVTRQRLCELDPPVRKELLIRLWGEEDEDDNDDEDDSGAAPDSDSSRAIAGPQQTTAVLDVAAAQREAQEPDTAPPNGPGEDTEANEKGQ